MNYTPPAPFESIAHEAFDLTKANESLTLPRGVTAKLTTIYNANKEKVVNAFVFEDGSELTMTPSGAFGWSNKGEWKAEKIESPEGA